MTRSCWTISVITLAALGLAGCSYFSSFVEETKPPILTPEGQRVDAASDGPTRYPDDAPLGEPLAIEVIRTGNGIQLDNRTVNAYADTVLWLNEQYGAKIGDVAIGRGQPIALESFVNHHGETYPVGRFLQPDADRPLILADLVVEGTRHKLTVRLQDWRQP